MNKEILHSAIGLLSRREHSILELKQKLSAKATDDVESQVIDEVIEYLIENDYVSNERYAESVIRNKISRGYGWQYIKQALKQNGIDSYIANQALEEQEVDWYVQAELAYQKRFGDMAITDQKDKAKRIRFMQYRGFSFDEIAWLLKTE